MRRVKSVSLMDRHYQIAERMPNFSSFVQEALDAYAADIGQGTHTYAPENRIHGKCNPMAKHLCKICWPDGRPDRDAWLQFRENPTIKISASQAGRYKQLVEQSFAYDEPKQEGGQAVTNNIEPKIGWFRRFWFKVF